MWFTLDYSGQNFNNNALWVQLGKWFPVVFMPALRQGITIPVEYNDSFSEPVD